MDYSAKLYVDGNALGINDEDLSDFQKILLKTDGTVTDLISIYANEKIRVIKISQKMSSSEESHDSIFPPNTQLLTRNVLLCGNNKNYIYAESVFVFERFSPSIQSKLLDTDQPIGLMWKEEKLETYRDVIAQEVEVCADVAVYFDVPSTTPIISRTYLIYYKKMILGKITEKFPITRFRRKI